MATGTFSNFIFNYPADCAISGGSGDGHGAVIIECPSDSIYAPRGFAINVATSTSFEPFRPNAKTLDDYKTNYLLEDFEPFEEQTKDGIVVDHRAHEVVIYSQEELTVNGIPMLRQIYSYGTLDQEYDGHSSFEATDEWGADHALRYVFFDGKSFVILVSGGSQNLTMDTIARSIRIQKSGK